LEDNEKRKAVWLANVPLGKTHELRAKINDGKTPDKDVLAEYDPSVVASALKLYLLELPGTFLFFVLTKIHSYHLLCMTSSRAFMRPTVTWRTSEVVFLPFKTH
jgi:hypothetical protein